MCLILTFSWPRPYVVDNCLQATFLALGLVAELNRTHTKILHTAQWATDS